MLFLGGNVLQEIDTPIRQCSGKLIKHNITDDLISTDYNVNVSTEFTSPSNGNLKKMTWRNDNIDQQAWDSHPVYVTQEAAS